MANHRGVELATEKEIKIKDVENHIVELFDLNQVEQIPLCQLPILFRNHFKEPIAYQSYGYRQLRTFVSDLPSLDVHGKGGGLACFITRNATQQGKSMLENVAINHSKSNKEIIRGRQIRRVERKILELFKSMSSIPLDQLRGQYESRYHETISFKHLGYKSLQDFICSLSSLHLKRTRIGQGLLSVLSLNQRQHKGPDGDSAILNGHRLENRIILNESTEETITILQDSYHFQKNLHGFLLKHPEGVTCNMVVKNVKGFKYALSQQGNDGHTVSPGVVLREMEGVTCMKMNNRILYFHASFMTGNKTINNECAKTTSRANSSDHQTVMINFMLHLSVKYGDNWPTAKKTLKALCYKFYGLDSSCDSHKQVVHGILLRLKEAGCLSGTSKSCIWDMTLANSMIQGKLRSPYESTNHSNVIQETEVSNDSENLTRKAALAAPVDATMYLDQACNNGEDVDIKMSQEQLYLTSENLKTTPIACNQTNREPNLNGDREDVTLETPSQCSTSAAVITTLLERTCNDLRNLNMGTSQGHAHSTTSEVILTTKCNSATQEQELRSGRKDTVIFVETAMTLIQACDELKEADLVAIDCEGVPQNLYLIQICAIMRTKKITYIFDCIQLDPILVCSALEDSILANPSIIKYFHDMHKDVLAMSRIGRVGSQFKGTFDTQLAAEALSGDIHVGFNMMLDRFGQGQQHNLKKEIHRKMNSSGNIFSKRPLPPDVLNYAVLDVTLLISVIKGIRDSLGEELWSQVQRASDRRAKSALLYDGGRHICFDENEAYQMKSFELWIEISGLDSRQLQPIDVVNDVDTLFATLPPDLSEALAKRGDFENLIEIVLDLGRPPHAWVKRKRVLLRDQVVTREDIDTVVENIGDFGGDNRSGLERKLHRISAIRNRSSEIIGLTMRVGRHVTGAALIIEDLLFSDPKKSILFLGEPGSGKTTIVRETSRVLAQRFNVCIIDTSNEIAGDGDVPHPCIGHARRMIVPSLNAQSDIMLECVQNHTPQIMVLDEIGRAKEVGAARTCKGRGVRLVASAHGSLRGLVKNHMLRALVGGVTSVTIGDKEARSASSGSSLQKVRSQRAGSPIFDIVIELKAGQTFTEYNIIGNVGRAVDKILEGQKYHIQRRTRHLDGAISMELDSA